MTWSMGWGVFPQNDWRQLRPGFNWRTFRFALIEIEDDRMLGAIEATVVLLGFGLRLRWTYTETELMRKIEAQAAEVNEMLKDEEEVK